MHPSYLLYFQDGSTALIEAAYENQLEVMLVLIEKGADVNFVDQVIFPLSNALVVIA